jgi:hypothetical protein
MIHVFSHSEAGGHAENEDAFELRPYPRGADCWLCAVADGQGGRSGGAAAARLACRTCLDGAGASPQVELLLPSNWVRIVQTADRAVANDPSAGLTTLIGFCLTQDWICGASSGDSALLVQSAGAAAEILTSGQMKNPPVGSGAVAALPFGHRLERPWVVLAMTDGVWKYAGWGTVLEVAAHTQGQDIIPSLLCRARLPRSGELQDDFTLLVLAGS